MPPGVHVAFGGIVAEGYEPRIGSNGCQLVIRRIVVGDALHGASEGEIAGLAAATVAIACNESVRERSFLGGAAAM